MALVNVDIDAASGTITHSSSKYLYVSPTRSLKIDKSLDYSGVLIDGKNNDFVKMIVKRIRGNTNPLIYLKPIILVNGNAHKDAYINSLTDGVIFSFDQLPLIHNQVAEINERIGKMTFINSISFEAMVISKLLYFMYARDQKSLEPVPYALSNTHYCYPFLSCNFNYKEEYQVLDILELAESEGVFKKSFIDRVYLCSNCKAGHLSYRETCPKCNSSHTDTYDIVHHFPCAYVGPVFDFQNDIDDQLHCPKCSKRLKHIGIDYDKPSVLHECKNCENRFQDFNVKAKCMSCTYDNSVESLVDESIYEYHLTKKGENYALQGYVSTPKDIEDIIGTVKFDTFKTVARYEVERLRQSEGSSNIVAISIINAGQFYAKVGLTGQQNLLKDIVGEVRSSIRSSDMITFYSSSVILITMFEIPNKIAQHIMDDIVRLLQKLIDNNFKDLRIDLKANVHQLNFNTSSELQINQLIR